MSEHQCVICGEFVSKRQSLAYNGGRACRFHDEIVEMVKLQEYERSTEYRLNSIKDEEEKFALLVSLVKEQKKNNSMFFILGNIERKYGTELARKIGNEFQTEWLMSSNK